jgi:hypothetical protein
VRISTSLFLTAPISANPPTGKHGHLGIVQYLIDLNEFDEIWILPVYVHQFSSKQLIDYENRLTMCRLTFEKLNGMSKTRVKVLPLERDVSESCGGRHGTIDTVTYILKSDDVSLHIIIGEDAYRDICLYRWKQADRSAREHEQDRLSLPLAIDRLFDLCKVHVIERLGISADSCQVPPLDIPSQFSCYRRHRVPFLTGVSSTVIRGTNAFPLWPLPIESLFLQEELDPAVYSYLKSHRLYNFSSEALWRQRRCRLCVLGVIVSAFLCKAISKSSS